MCGRFTLRHSTDEVVEHFALDPDRVAEIEPRFNIAPTQPIAVVRRAGGVAERELALVRWGLVPGWVEDPTDWPLLINARGESAPDKPAFRDAFRSGRCLLPASGFYEWRKENGHSTPYYVRHREDRPIAYAGLWDRREREGEETLESAVVLTCDPNELLAALHDRMPVILPPDAYDAWLDPMAGPAELGSLLRPLPAGETIAHPIGRRVNSVHNDDPELVEAVGEPLAAGGPPPREQMDLGL